jgi:hypothetical protein
MKDQRREKEKVFVNVRQQVANVCQQVIETESPVIVATPTLVPIRLDTQKVNQRSSWGGGLDVLVSTVEEHSYLSEIATNQTITSLLPPRDLSRLLPQRRVNSVMSDKLSSPSASSHSTVFSPRGSKSNNGDESYLVVRRQPPTYVYSNQSFDVEINLQIPKTASPPTHLGAHEIEIVATLHNQKTGRICAGEAILITEPSRILLSPIGEASKRSVKVRCMIRTDVIERDQGSAVELRFTPRQDMDPSLKAIAGVGTNAIHLVNYKIKISMEEDWGRVWYKDEGGRDKSMEVFAAIYDKDGQLRTGEQIPLLPILCYESDASKPVSVTNQEILRTLGSTKIFLDKDTGKARIRFRVEDVSKNHQGQDFIMEVGTDPKVKGFKDVAPAYTPPVNVRSKRNKRSRKESNPGRGPTDRRPSPVNRPRESSYDPGEVSFDGADVGRLQEAMKGVINWADEVVNGLYPLQWQVLGYAQHPDGSPDYSRPYHNMPNPNPCISRILATYSESVRESLRILLNAVESSGSPPDTPYMPMAAPMPRDSEDPYGMMRSPPPPIHQAAMPPAGRRPGMHPSIASEAFREKMEMPFQARAQLPPMHQPLPPFLRGRPGPQGMPPMEEGDMIQMHGQPPHRRVMPPHPMAHDVPMQRSLHHPSMQEEESRESEVEYVLAKQYKALRTGGRLGFPAYSANKEILGFYRESNSKVGVGQFTPISRHRNDFGPLEIMQATEILEDSIQKKSEAVHVLKEWGSIANLLDHALVYDWSKDIGTDLSAPPGGV